MSWSTRRYLREKANFEAERGYTENEYKASDLRKNFLKKFIINYDTYNYKTTVERDWAYIAKREYTYDVELRSSAYGFLAANVVLIGRLLMTKKMVWWPFVTVWPAGYYYHRPSFLQKYNK